MDPERASRLYLEACFHLDIRTRLKKAGRDEVGKKDLPVMAESLKRIARGTGGGPFRPPSDSVLFKEMSKEMLKEYLRRSGRKINDSAYCRYLIQGVLEMEPAMRRAFFNELAWFMYDNGLDAFDGDGFLKQVYDGAGIGRRPYARYASKFRPGSTETGAESSAVRSGGRANRRLAAVLLMVLMIGGAAAWYYSSWHGEAEPVGPPERRITYRTVRFTRAVVAGPIRGEGRSPGRAEMYIASGTAEVWFDVAGLSLEPQGEGFRAVYAAEGGGDYVFPPLRAGVVLDRNGARETMSVVLGAGNDRARIEPLGFMSASGAGLYRTAVSDGGEEHPPLYKFSGTLADASTLFGRGVSAGWAASGGMAAGLAGGATPYPERLDSAVRRLIGARILFNLPPVEEMRTDFEAGVVEYYRKQGKDVIAFEYREAGA